LLLHPQQLYLKFSGFNSIKGLLSSPEGYMERKGRQKPREDFIQENVGLAGEKKCLGKAQLRVKFLYLNPFE